MTMRAGRAAALVLGGALALACGNDASTSVTTPAESSPVSESPTTPSPDPTRAVPTPEPSLGNGVPTGDIPAGTYTADGFSPSVTFTIGEGWTQTLDPEAAVDEALLLVYTPEPGDEAIYIDSKAPTIEPATSLRNTFGRLKGVTLSEPFEVTVGGATGLAADGQIAPDLPEPEQQVFGLSEDYFMRPGDRFRAYALELGGDPFYIIVESTADGFDAFLEIASPVVESMTFG
jgi:hypothetical protein